MLFRKEGELMVNKSIAYRLSFYVSIAVILIFLAFILAYFFFNQRLLKENIENKAIGLSSQVNSIIRTEVNSVIGISTHLSDQVEYYQRQDNLEKLIKPVLMRYPFILSIQVYFDSLTNISHHFYSVVRTGDSIIYTQGEKPFFQTANEKEYFVNASNSMSAGWKEISSPGTELNATVSYHHPLFIDAAERSGIKGLVITRLSLRDLNDRINQIKIDALGYAFLIDSNGDYITYPNVDKSIQSDKFAPSLVFINNDVSSANDFFAGKEKGSAIAYPEIMDNEKSWIYFSSIPHTSWHLIYVMPYHELFRELYDVTIRMSIFAFFGILLIYFLVSYIIRRELKPLSNVTSRLTSFSSPFKLNTKNEVKQVANSLEFLKVWFEQYQIARQKDELYNYQHNRDIKQASEIQQSLIKTSFPAFPERNDVDLFSLYQPAQVVSGDLFDYFFIDTDTLVFTIGDVSGKGIAAAIFMSVCQTVIKNNSMLFNPKRIVEKTNSELCTSNHHQYFLTLFLGVLNLKTGTLNYCNAAHTFPLILKASGEITEIKATHGLPLGLYAEKEYGEDQVQIGNGDTIILFTDGVADALKTNNMHQVSEWFRKNLENKMNHSPREIIELLENDLPRADVSAKDDICLLAVKRQ